MKTTDIIISIQCSNPQQKELEKTILQSLQKAMQGSEYSLTLSLRETTCKELHAASHSKGQKKEHRVGKYHKIRSQSQRENACTMEVVCLNSASPICRFCHPQDPDRSLYADIY